MSENALQKNQTHSSSAIAEPAQGVSFTPRVDILETGEELVLCADMPGVKPEDVEIRYERGELVVHGKCAPRQTQTKYLYSEYGVGDFYRTFSLSEHLDASKITARLQNGVLEVHLPKLETVKPRKIAVQGE